MSNLPYEILDHIVDLLHDSQIPLGNCCLASKSWIPRTRRHLFAEVRFQTARNLQSWKKTFPDPSTSPACYTKALLIGPEVLTDADLYTSSWIGGFSRVVRLELVGQDPFGCGWRVACVLLPGFSPVVKSLRLDFSTFIGSPSQLFDLIFSFPLLENLSVIDYNTMFGDCGDPDEVSTVIQPSSLSMFTGSLNLRLGRGIRSSVHRLLSLPGGVHFRKLTLAWSYGDDIPLMMALVEKCSHTLESLDIICDSLHSTSIRHLRLHGGNSPLFPASPESASFNLLKATKLQDAVFRPSALRVEWITLTLRVITREHRDLRQISVNVPSYLDHPLHVIDGDVRAAIGEEIFEQWLDLDRILVHIWESFSIRTNVKWTTGGNVGCLLPEMKKRGMVTTGLVG